jgi:hypothetical protein
MSAGSFAAAYAASQSAEAEGLMLLRQALPGMTVVSSECGREGKVREPYTAEEALEWGHIDGLVFDDGVAYGFAARTRPYRRSRRDLSIRVSPRSGDGETELDDVLRARDTGGITPRWYCFGLTLPPGLADIAGLRFRHWFLVDANKLFDALAAGTVEYDGPLASNRDDLADRSEAIYISVNNLRDLGAVEHEFHAADWD